MSIYWSKVFVVLAVAVAITLIIVFGVKAGMSPTLIASIVVPLSLALSQLLPAVANAKTSFPPPPMPPDASVESVTVTHEEKKAP